MTPKPCTKEKTMEEVSLQEITSIVGGLRCKDNNETSGAYLKHIFRELKKEGVLFFRADLVERKVE